jgi:predicted amidohydrolase
MQPLTVSLIQTTTHWHSPNDNRALFERLFAEVPDDAQIVVLPEMFSTGFTMSASEVAEPMQGPTLTWLREQALGIGKVICGSLVIVDGGRYYNRFVWVTPEGSVTSYDKRHLFRMTDEHRYYAAGKQRRTVVVGEWRVCLMICYDLRFPVWFRNRGDYDVLLCVANWPAERQQIWNTLLRARAVENQCYCVGVNVVGTDGNGVGYSGGSAIYTAEGNALLEAGELAGVFTTSLGGDALLDYRRRFPAWQDADEFSLADER